MADLKKLLEEVKGMTVLELNEFVKMIEEEFGVSAAAMAVAAPAAGGAAAPAEEEQTEFTVVLKEIGLGEAKSLVDGAPSTVKEGLSKEAATELVNKFKEAGATAEMK